MKILLDTHLLLWAAAGAGLSADAEALIDSPDNQPNFSAGSIWEIAIKSGLGRPDFKADPHRLRRALLDSGYSEIPITAEQAAGVSLLPAIHKDPFDRLLISQAMAEGMLLLTADRTLALYPGPVRLV